MKRGADSGQQALRIGIFSPALPGGGEKVLLYLAEGFLQFEYGVDLVLAEAVGPYLSQVHPDIRIVDLQATSPLAKIIGLVRYLRRTRPVLLITADDYAAVAPIAKRFALVDTTIAAGVHNTVSELFRTQNGLRATLRHLLFPYLLTLAEYIIPVSRTSGEDLVKSLHVNPRRIRVIYNAAIDEKAVEKAREPVAEPWFNPGEAPVVISVGRLSAQKDFKTLIRAFSLVLKETDARLVILGEGDERAELERLILDKGLAGHVRLPGFVSNPYALIARSAAFVSSSLFEGLPTVLIEAMALGKPVIATNCAASAEVLEGGKWGTLVPTADPESLAKAILVTLKNPTVPDGLAGMLDQRFSIRNIVQMYLNLENRSMRRPAYALLSEFPCRRHIDHGEDRKQAIGSVASTRPRAKT